MIMPINLTSCPRVSSLMGTTGPSPIFFASDSNGRTAETNLFTFYDCYLVFKQILKVEYYGYQ